MCVCVCLTKEKFAFVFSVCVCVYVCMCVQQNDKLRVYKRIEISQIWMSVLAFASYLSDAQTGLPPLVILEESM